MNEIGKYGVSLGYLARDKPNTADWLCVAPARPLDKNVAKVKPFFFVFPWGKGPRCYVGKVKAALVREVRAAYCDDTFIVDGFQPPNARVICYEDISQTYNAKVIGGGAD